MRAALLLLALAGAATAEFVVRGDRAIVYDRKVIPRPWTPERPATAEDKVDFTIALYQRNLDVLERAFWDVSNPDSPNFTRYMTVEEINGLVGNPDAVHAVIEWLLKEGMPFSTIEDLGDAVAVRGLPATSAASLFKTNFHVFVEPSSGARAVKQVGEWSIPAYLLPSIELVAGVSDFPVPHLSLHRTTPDASSGVIVPRGIRRLYNISDDEAASNGASQGVIEFQDDSAYEDSDMTTFYQQTGTKAQTIAHKVGTFNPTPNTESVLDIQYLTAVGVGADDWYWTTPNWLYDFSVKFVNTKSVPSVISMSFGWSEADQCEIDQNDCSQLGVDSHGYVSRVNTEWQKIGLRGVSILASSGDSGANGRTDPFCSGTALKPTYPAASPYLTAVGATQVQNAKIGSFPDKVCSQYQCISGGEEVAVSYQVAGFTSGGGFSNVAPRPSYQDKAVSQFLSTSSNLPPSSYFNQTSRGYPDVAAIGNAFLIYQSGSWSQVGGTSASSPTVAGIVALLNDARIAAGKKPLGFLNPTLYKIWAEEPSAFNDVTSGDNKCTEQGCASGCKGFAAIKGWDPVTGLGTPNFGVLRDYVVNRLA